MTPTAYSHAHRGTRRALAPVVLAALAAITHAADAQSAPATKRPAPTSPAATPTIAALRAQNDSLRRIIDSLRPRTTRATGDVDILPPPNYATASASGMAAGQGPFGLTFGMNEKTLRATSELTSVPTVPGAFRLARVPKPLNTIESYTGILAPKAGLCKIIATGITLVTNGFGTQVSSGFDTMFDLVSEKYGKGTRLDFLRAGSIWTEPQEWMMSLAKKDRTLVGAWRTEDGATLPPAISVVLLETVALSTDRGYLRLTFDGANIDACLKEIRTNPL